MKTPDINLAKWDRILRAGLGAAIVLIWFFGFIPADLATGLLIIAGALIANSLMGVCFLYKLLGLSTCPVKKPKT